MLKTGSSPQAGRGALHWTIPTHQAGKDTGMQTPGFRISLVLKYLPTQWYPPPGLYTYIPTIKYSALALFLTPLTSHPMEQDNCPLCPLTLPQSFLQEQLTPSSSTSFPSNHTSTYSSTWFPQPGDGHKPLKVSSGHCCSPQSLGLAQLFTAPSTSLTVSLLVISPGSGCFSWLSATS